MAGELPDGIRMTYRLSAYYHPIIQQQRASAHQPPLSDIPRRENKIEHLAKNVKWKMLDNVEQVTPLCGDWNGSAPAVLPTLALAPILTTTPRLPT